MRRHLSVVAISTLVALVSVEAIVLRGILGYRGIVAPPIIQRDLEIGWVVTPNTRAWHSALDFGVWIQTDELGLRVPLGPRPAASAQPSAEQVLVLGDSFAFGWGVPAERMFASELERQLSMRGRPYAVRSAGVPGYSTDQEYLLWKRLSTTMRPRQVVLLLHASDPPANIQDSALMDRFAYPKPHFQIADGRLQVLGVPVPDKRPLAPDTMFEPVKRRVRPLAMYALGRWLLYGGLWIPGRPQAQAAPPPLDPAAYTMTAALLGALDADTRAHGATLLVALIPTDPVMTDALATICRTLRIAVLDLRPAFRNQTDVLLVHDGHWNAKGHQIAARAVAPFVR